MTVYTYDEGDFFIDDDAISAFTDDNAEDVILAEQLGFSEGGSDLPVIRLIYRKY